MELTMLRGELPHWTDYGYGYGSGYGDGYGYSDGSGDGYGYGDGSGYGYGSGYGDGYGYSDGSGDGYGYGSGYGYGYGSGDGSGDGYGYSYGYSYGSQYWTQFAQAVLFKDHPQAVREATTIAFWKSAKNGHPSNGGSSRDMAKPGLKQEIEGPLGICTEHALHATMQPDKWKGERLWVVALYGEVQWQDDKCAALKREILFEIPILNRL